MTIEPTVSECITHESYIFNFSYWATRILIIGRTGLRSRPRTPRRARRRVASSSASTYPAEPGLVEPAVELEADPRSREQHRKPGEAAALAGRNEFIASQAGQGRRRARGKSRWLNSWLMPNAAPVGVVSEPLFGGINA
jgi:hypothetical protein